MTTASGVLSHQLHDFRFHSWKISGTNEVLARHVVAKYYQNEDSHLVNTLHSPNVLKKASKRAHSLTLCSQISCQKLIQAKISEITKWYKIEETGSQAIVHHVDHLSNTHFAEQTTQKQKRFLASQSGMTGLLISRLLCLKEQEICHIRSARNLSHKLATYVHSEFSAEILMGNRYFYRLPQLICADYSKCFVVGVKNRGITEIIPNDLLSPTNINQTKSLVVELYQKHIGQIELAVSLFKRGELSLEAIRTNPDFVKLLAMFWHYTNLLMAVQKNIGIGIGSDRDVKRTIAISNLCSIAILLPGLFSFDVAHIFDNPHQSFVRLIKTTKEAYIRLANDGLTAAFLAFGAIEPEMISEIASPVISDKMMNFDLNSHANYISKRDPTFGSFRLKFDKYIPKSSSRIIFRTRDRFVPTYYPIRFQLEDLGSNGARRQELVRVNRYFSNQ